MNYRNPSKITTRYCFAPGALFTRRRLSFFLSTNVFKKKKKKKKERKKKKKKKNRSCPAFAFADGRLHPEEEETMEKGQMELMMMKEETKRKKINIVNNDG